VAKSSRRPTDRGTVRPNEPPGAGSGGRSPSTGSTGPTGSSRAGRRETHRRPVGEPGALERFRTPILVAVVAVALVGVSVFIVFSASASAYSCNQAFAWEPAPSGEIGQIQQDLGTAHIGTGDRVTYVLCPPASGKHVNRAGFGPLEPRVYGPDDRSEPQGWVHNLEHGGLVLLYSCEKGACDDTTLAALRDFSRTFPDSPVCGQPAGIVGPVIARFEQMPARFAALLWGRVLYLDTLDIAQIHAFYLRYAERLSTDGGWISPPEPQCPAPTASPSATLDASPSPSG
jgi:hypothetical protein